MTWTSISSLGEVCAPSRPMPCLVFFESSLQPPPPPSHTQMRRASCCCCIFLCIVLATAHLKYCWRRFSCLPFDWRLLFIVTHTHSPLSLSLSPPPPSPYSSFQSYPTHFLYSFAGDVAAMLEDAEAENKREHMFDSVCIVECLAMH